MSIQRFYKGRQVIGQPIIANNSEVLAVGDPLSIDANGHLIYAAAGTKVIGYCMEAKTHTSDNETVAKYCPQYIEAEGVSMLYESDQACTQTDIGAYADVVGTTGATYMNLNAGATGQFIILAFDPEGESDTDLVVVKVAEPQTSAFAQS